MIQYIAPFIQLLELLLSLSILVFVHELGHYLAARMFGVRVEKFFLFFDTGGRAIFRYKSKRSGTVFGLGWLPLGGYCRISGMVDEHYLETGERTNPKPYEMRSKSAWKRIVIMLGGIVFNIIFAMLIYTFLSFSQGKSVLMSRDISAGMMFSEAAHKVGFQDNDVILTVNGEERNVLDDTFINDFIEAKEVEVLRDGTKMHIEIPNDMMKRVLASKEGLLSLQMPFVADSVLRGSAAETAGIVRGDQLLAIDTIKIMDYSEAQRIFSNNRYVPLQLSLLRGADTLSTVVTPDSLGRIGISLANLSSIYPVSQIRYGFYESIAQGVKRSFSTLFGYASNMKHVFSREGASQVGGFITMGKLFSGAFDWSYFWQTTALLSIIFAFMNFLPIPMLDGAEIIFLLGEIITRRKINENFLMRTKMVGLVLLMLLFVWANVSDVWRIFSS